MTKVGIKEILVAGGPTLFLLIGLSIYSIALIWERWRFYQRALSGLKPLLDKVRRILQDGDLADAVSLGRQYKGLAGPVILASLIGPSNREERKRSAERAAARAVQELERGVSQLGTIASVAPFIGLLGTVIGVMHAFRDLASASGAGPGVVAIGISEALVCTAAGLVVAIPAVAAYNYFNNQSARFFDETRWLGEEIIESLADKAHK
jgi:biopolymer transport protein ExbB/TolQ